VTRVRHAATVLVLTGACSTAGSTWMAEPLEAEFAPPPEASPELSNAEPRAAVRSRVLGASPATPDLNNTSKSAESGGVLLGTFHNSYYDFPSESDFDGENVSLMSAQCQPIASVARGFYESVCVQGSGTLRSGGTVSFAKRDCACALPCPRTAQRICFDLLDRAEFPWGRGALGKPITPLLSVAVDSDVIAMGSALYIPEYAGLPRDPEQSSLHDGCFVAHDRGLSVKGRHIDVFTGHRSMTALWNRLVPTGQGITVMLDHPQCRR
jgi:3D (Asp-Asp-Asp) domain-containing protein